MILRREGPIKINVSWQAANRVKVRIFVRPIDPTAAAGKEIDFSPCALRALNKPAATGESFNMLSRVIDRCDAETTAEVWDGDSKIRDPLLFLK